MDQEDLRDKLIEEYSNKIPGFKVERHETMYSNTGGGKYVGHVMGPVYEELTVFGSHVTLNKKFTNGSGNIVYWGRYD